MNYGTYNYSGVVTWFADWQAEGWKVEADEGRYEVYYHTHEAMRLGADGSLGIGRPEGYWFNTLEWARLCAERLNSLERAFMPSTTYTLGVGNAPSNQWQFRAGPKPLITVDQGGQVTQFDLPEMVKIWFKTTWVPKAWNRLLWGEKGKQ